MTLELCFCGLFNPRYHVACADGHTHSCCLCRWAKPSKKYYKLTCMNVRWTGTIPEVAVARSYRTFRLTERWIARANLKILLKLCFAFLLSCWENGPGLLYFLERALTMTSYLFLFEKEWRVVDARL